MDSRRPALREVLYPQCFKAHPKRSEVTRTINQFDGDEFQRSEDGLGQGRCADPAKRAAPGLARGAA